MREIGFYDDQGSLFVVGNLLHTYKPVAGKGTFLDATIRVQFPVSNVLIVSVAIDPDVAVAFAYLGVQHFRQGANHPEGYTDQVLAKTGNADGA
ncbi:phage tail protein [Pseudomonas oryzihabitans]|nr:phage tail protein [Pseudomonas oryzihabitans]